MESGSGKCDPFDGVYSRVSFNLLRLESKCIAFLRLSVPAGAHRYAPCTLLMLLLLSTKHLHAVRIRA